MFKKWYCRKCNAIIRTTSTLDSGKEIGKPKYKFKMCKTCGEIVEPVKHSK